MLQRATFTSWALPPPPSISRVHPAFLTDYDFELGQGAAPDIGADDFPLDQSRRRSTNVRVIP